MCRVFIKLIFTVPRLVVIAVQRDPDPALLRRPEIFIVRLNGAGVAHDECFADDPWLRRGIAFSGSLIDATSPRGIATSSVTLPVLVATLVLL